MLFVRVHESACGTFRTWPLWPTMSAPGGRAEVGFGGLRSHHHKVDLPILEAFARKVVPRHFLEPDPVLAEIAGSLVLRLKFRLQAAGVARSTVCDLKKDRLLSFFEVRFWRGMTHRLFLCERLTGPIFEMHQQCPICAALL